MRTEQGVLLGNRYELTNRIAFGGMGEVWEAVDTILGRDVAVKIMKEELRTASTFLERFRAEARHAGALSHPGIASVFDYGEGPDVAYLVMELVPGQPLSDLMAGEALTDAAKVSILRQAADALQAAHDAGVIHRDVKPGNLLVRPDGTVKVTDFGIARALSSVPLTDTGQLIGTPAYMSPEQASGGHVTASSDVYSLGVVGYELFAGRRPFERDTPVALAVAHVQHLPPPLPGSVPRRIAKVIEAALAKDPRRRPRTAGEFSSRLRSALPAAADMATFEANIDGSPATRVMDAPAVMPRAFDDDRTAAALPVMDAATSPSPTGRREEQPAGRRRSHIPTLAFGLLLAVVAVAIWAATTADDGKAAQSPSATQITESVVPQTSAAPTTPASTVPVTVAPPTSAPAAPGPPPGKPDQEKVKKDEALAFLMSYYAALAAGDYDTTWPLLSEEFRAERNLTFERYVAYWERYSIELSDLRFSAGPEDDEGRVRFDARYTSSDGTILETDEITLRRQADGSLIIVAQRLV